MNGDDPRVHRPGESPSHVARQVPHVREGVSDDVMARSASKAGLLSRVLPPQESALAGEGSDRRAATPLPKLRGGGADVREVLETVGAVVLLTVALVFLWRMPW